MTRTVFFFIDFGFLYLKSCLKVVIKSKNMLNLDCVGKCVQRNYLLYTSYNKFCFLIKKKKLVLSSGFNLQRKKGHQYGSSRFYVTYYHRLERNDKSHFE